MKKTILISFILILSVSWAWAQDMFSKSQLQVQETIKGLFQSISDRDTNQLKSYCTADVMFLEYGLVWNADTLTRKISQISAADYSRTNSFEFIDTRVSGNSAWTSFFNQAEITLNGKRGFTRWLETAILVKEKNTWKVRVFHSTLVKRGTRD